MPDPEFHSYVFQNQAQWRAGVYSNFEAADSGLHVPPGFTWEPVSGADSRDATPALAFDPCGRLQWVRAESGELVCLYDFGPQCVGSLRDAEGARALVAGATRLWVLKAEKILRYSERTLGLLGYLSFPRRILAIAGDGCEGIWLLEGGGQNVGSVRHLDAFGCETGYYVDLPMPVTAGMLAQSYDGRNLALLVYDRQEGIEEPCHQYVDWRLIILDIEEVKVSVSEEAASVDPDFHPRLLAADRERKIYLADPTTAEIRVFDFTGRLEIQHKLHVPQSRLPLTGLAAHQGIVLSDAGGIARLRTKEASDENSGEIASVFITPTLVSPEGALRGWASADVDVELPEGTTLEISYAAKGSNSADRYFARSIDTLLAHPTRPSPAKLRELTRRLEWQGLVVFAGDSAVGIARHRYLLHEVDKPHLWLRLSFYTPPGRMPPKLKSLKVHYPNLSYLRYLPAIYREDSRAAAQLVRFLAPFESLFGNMDAAIERLPRDIDPNTAPADRLGFLLRWLGMPTPSTLGVAVQRKLLKAAPRLLVKRGTRHALEELIGILTEGASISVEDRAAGPAPWVLPSGSSTVLAPRLSCETLVVAKTPRPFCIGKTPLGDTPLGEGNIDFLKTFTGNIGEVRIRIAASNESKDRLEPLIHVYLPYFVPAHCRVSLEFVSPGAWTQKQLLDVNVRLASKKIPHLGSETVLGCFPLPVLPLELTLVDRGTYLDGKSRLA